MRRLKIMIFKVAWVSIMALPVGLPAQQFHIRAGVYDYLDGVARDYYLCSPTLLLGIDCFTIENLKLNVAAGFGYRSFKYNENKHQLFTVPVFITVNYDLRNNDARLYPSFGMGLSLMAKADKNISLEKTHRSFTYGYHFRGSLNYRSANKLVWFFDILYNLLVPPAMEEINLKGVILTVGVKIPLRSKE